MNTKKEQSKNRGKCKIHSNLQINTVWKPSNPLITKKKVLKLHLVYLGGFNCHLLSEMLCSDLKKNKKYRRDKEFHQNFRRLCYLKKKFFRSKNAQVYLRPFKQ